MRWALRHLNEFGDTDLFPRPFELGIMAENQAKVIAHVRALDLPQYKWSEPRRALVLKDELAFRSATQLDPLDAVVFAALIRHDCKRLDARRGDDHESRVFSYGVEPRADGQLSGKDRYREFWQRNAELAAEHAVVLTTDISISTIRSITIRSSRAEDAGVSSDAFHAYVNLLRKSSVTTSRGIPIGPHGAHLLAEVAFASWMISWCKRGLRSRGSSMTSTCFAPPRRKPGWPSIRWCRFSIL
ncbi:MAG: hypothetical protein IPG50_09520 [Myxococcales bacterium]|nr:hypothetical protein [Myxococcales bacterium]